MLFTTIGDVSLDTVAAIAAGRRARISIIWAVIDHHAAARDRRVGADVVITGVQGAGLSVSTVRSACAAQRIRARDSVTLLTRVAGRYHTGFIGRRAIGDLIAAAGEGLVDTLVSDTERARAEIAVVRAIVRAGAAAGLDHDLTDVVGAWGGGAWVAVVSAGRLLGTAAWFDVQGAAVVEAHGGGAGIIVIGAL